MRGYREMRGPLLTVEKVFKVNLFLPYTEDF